MPWDKSLWNIDLLAWYKKLIAIRKAHPALRRGEYVSLYAHKEVYAFLRRLEGEVMVVVLNNSEEVYRLDVPLKGYLPDGTILYGLLGSGEARVTGGRLRELSLSPRTGAILSLSR